MLGAYSMTSGESLILVNTKALIKRIDSWWIGTSNDTMRRDRDELKTISADANIRLADPKKTYVVGILDALWNGYKTWHDEEGWKGLKSIYLRNLNRVAAALPVPPVEIDRIIEKIVEIPAASTSPLPSVTPTPTPVSTSETYGTAPVVKLKPNAGRIAAMQDFTGEGTRDNHGHGTHVAGIAAGGGSRYRGVAPEALLYAAKVLHGDGSGYMSEVIAGLEWAVQQRVKVINLSLGGVGPCDGSDALSTACDAAVDQGVMVCVAAGNYGPGASTVGPPGCARNVLTVGACSTQDVIPSFSARGPTSDGRVKPDVLLPGVDIVACRAQNTSMGMPVDALYAKASGTSMATPHAAGLAALLLQAFPDLTPAQLKERLMNTAKDLGQDANAQGKGRADAYQAYLGSSVTPPPPPQPGGCLLSLLQLFRSGQ